MIMIKIPRDNFEIEKLTEENFFTVVDKRCFPTDDVGELFEDGTVRSCQTLMTLMRMILRVTMLPIDPIRH